VGHGSFVDVVGEHGPELAQISQQLIGMSSTMHNTKQQEGEYY
jgi:hypothetical protein